MTSSDIYVTDIQEVLGKFNDSAISRNASIMLLGTDVISNCLHPGVIKTKLLRAGFGDYPGSTPEKGARTSVYLASSPDVHGITGQYFQDAKPVRSSPLSYNRSFQERLWPISEMLVGTG